MCAGGNSGRATNVSTPGDLAKAINTRIGSSPTTEIAKQIPFNIPVNIETQISGD